MKTKQTPTPKSKNIRLNHKEADRITTLLSVEIGYLQNHIKDMESRRETNSDHLNTHTDGRKKDLAELWTLWRKINKIEQELTPNT